MIRRKRHSRRRRWLVNRIFFCVFSLFSTFLSSPSSFFHHYCYRPFAPFLTFSPPPLFLLLQLFLHIFFFCVSSTTARKWCLFSFVFFISLFSTLLLTFFSFTVSIFSAFCLSCFVLYTFFSYFNDYFVLIFHLLRFCFSSFPVFSLP